LGRARDTRSADRCDSGRCFGFKFLAASDLQFALPVMTDITFLGQFDDRSQLSRRSHREFLIESGDLIQLQRWME